MNVFSLVCVGEDFGQCILLVCLMQWW